MNAAAFPQSPSSVPAVPSPSLAALTRVRRRRVILVHTSRWQSKPTIPRYPMLNSPRMSLPSIRSSPSYIQSLGYGGSAPLRVRSILRPNSSGKKGVVRCRDPQALSGTQVHQRPLSSHTSISLCIVPISSESCITRAIWRARFSLPFRAGLPPPPILSVSFP